MMRKLLAVVAMLAVASAPLFFMGNAESDELQGAPTIVTPTFSNSFVLWSGGAGDTTAVGMADSTNYLITKNYERLYLYLKPNRPVSFAVQVRSHGIADSSFFSMTDSIGSYVWPWNLTTNHTNEANQRDSTVWTENDWGTAAAPSETELVVRLTGTATSARMWQGPRGIVIPLRRENGDWYWGAATTIRIRVLTADGVVTWYGSLRGVPWGGYR